MLQLNIALVFLWLMHAWVYKNGDVSLPAFFPHNLGILTMQSPAHTDATTQSGFSFYSYYLIDSCVIIMFFLFVQFNAIQAVQIYRLRGS